MVTPFQVAFMSFAPRGRWCGAQLAGCAAARGRILCSLLLVGILCGLWFWFPGPGLAPACELLSFASPKESSQRKGDPTVCDPSLRCEHRRLPRSAAKGSQTVGVAFSLLTFFWRSKRK